MTCAMQTSFTSCTFKQYATSQTVRRSPALLDNLHHSLYAEHLLSRLAPLLPHPLLLTVNLLPVLEWGGGHTWRDGRYQWPWVHGGRRECFRSIHWVQKIVFYFTITCSLVPRPLPNFILQRIFLRSCEMKSGSGLRMRLSSIILILVWTRCLLF